MKKALITGITGQIGSYLAEFLLEKGYEVHGLIRPTSNPLNKNIEGIIDKITIHHGDVTDSASLDAVISTVYPDEIYNLAALSNVRKSFDAPILTMDINAGGLLNILECVKYFNPSCKIYQACTSEMFGKVQQTSQNENTPFYPVSPYAISKVTAFYIAKFYREVYGMPVYTGILFNTESPRRGEDFLTKKVCKGVAEIAKGLRSKITLGNLNAKRDWGYAPEYVEWIWKIMQYRNPGEFIIATGETHSVREIVDEAFWQIGITNWEPYVDYDKKLLRPGEVDVLVGDATKSKVLLGFEPKVKFKEIIKIMMDHELSVLNK